MSLDVPVPPRGSEPGPIQIGSDKGIAKPSAESLAKSATTPIALPKAQQESGLHATTPRQVQTNIYQLKKQYLEHNSSVHALIGLHSAPPKKDIQAKYMEIVGKVEARYNELQLKLFDLPDKSTPEADKIRDEMEEWQEILLANGTKEEIGRDRDKIGHLTTSGENAEKLFQMYENRLARLDGRLGKISSQGGKVDGQIAQAEKDIAQLEKDIAKLQERENELGFEAATPKDIEAFKADKAKLEKDIAKFNGDLKKLNSKITDRNEFAPKLKKLRGEVQILKTSIPIAKQKYVKDVEAFNGVSKLLNEAASIRSAIRNAPIKYDFPPQGRAEVNTSEVERLNAALSEKLEELGIHEREPAKMEAALQKKLAEMEKRKEDLTTAKYALQHDEQTFASKQAQLTKDERTYELFGKEIAALEKTQFEGREIPLREIQGVLKQRSADLDKKGEGIGTQLEGMATLHDDLAKKLGALLTRRGDLQGLKADKEKITGQLKEISRGALVLRQGANDPTKVLIGSAQNSLNPLKSDDGRVKEWRWNPSLSFGPKTFKLFGFVFTLPIDISFKLFDRPNKDVRYQTLYDGIKNLISKANTSLGPAGARDVLIHSVTEQTVRAMAEPSAAQSRIQMGKIRQEAVGKGEKTSVKERLRSPSAAIQGPEIVAGPRTGSITPAQKAQLLADIGAVGLRMELGRLSTLSPTFGRAPHLKAIDDQREALKSNRPVKVGEEDLIRELMKRAELVADLSDPDKQPSTSVNKEALRLAVRDLHEIEGKLEHMREL